MQFDYAYLLEISAILVIGLVACEMTWESWDVLFEHWWIEFTHKLHLVSPQMSNINCWAFISYTYSNQVMLYYMYSICCILYIFGFVEIFDYYCMILQNLKEKSAICLVWYFSIINIVKSTSKIANPGQLILCPTILVQLSLLAFTILR